MLAMVLAQPCPVSPRPWRKMRLAVCFPAGATTTGSGMLARETGDTGADLELFPPMHRHRQLVVPLSLSLASLSPLKLTMTFQLTPV